MMRAVGCRVKRPEDQLLAAAQNGDYARFTELFARVDTPNDVRDCFGASSIFRASRAGRGAVYAFPRTRSYSNGRNPTLRVRPIPVGSVSASRLLPSHPSPLTPAAIDCAPLGV